MPRFFTLILSLFMFSALNHYAGAEMAESLFLIARAFPSDNDRMIVFGARPVPDPEGWPGFFASGAGQSRPFPRNKIIRGNTKCDFIMPDTGAAKPHIKKADNHRRNLIAGLREIFRNEGIPDNLVWLAEVESSLNPEAVSPAGAVGLFQFMPDTAQRFGLKIFPVDDRKRPDKSAQAAARYLRWLHGEFGGWALALAAYNAGEGRVGRAMKNNDARTFHELAPYLPAETRRYVPRVMTIMALREDQMRGVPAALFRP